MAGGIAKRKLADGTMRYIVRWTDPVTGLRESARYATKKDADTKLVWVNAELLAGRRPEAPTSLASSTVKEFLIDKFWDMKDISEETRIGYMIRFTKRLIPYFGDMALVDIRMSSLTDYIKKERKAGTSDVNLGGDLRVLSALLNAAIFDEDEPLAENVVKKLPREYRPKPGNFTGRKIKRDQLQKIIATMPSKMDAAITGLGGMVTLAASEIVGLRDCDVDLVGYDMELADGRVIRMSTVNVEQAITPRQEGAHAPKTESRVRVVPIPPQLLAMLQAYAEERGDYDPQSMAPFFRNHEGKPIDWLNWYKRHWKPIVWVKLGHCKKTAEGKLVEGLRFHDLRHTSISAIRKHNQGQTQLSMAVAGHSQESTHGRYTHVDEEEKALAVAVTWDS